MTKPHLASFVARLYWPICMLIAFCESIFNCPAVTIQLQRCNVCCMQRRHVCLSAAFNTFNINNTNISTHSIHQLLNRRYFLQSNFPIGFSFVPGLIATPWTNQLWDFEVLDLCSMLRLHFVFDWHATPLPLYPYILVLQWQLSYNRSTACAFVRLVSCPHRMELR